MAQLPLDEETILGLQKSGKISAQTAEMARAKALAPDYSPTYPKEQVDRVFADPANFYREAKSDEYMKARDFYAQNPDFDPKAYKPSMTLAEIGNADKNQLWTPTLAKDKEYYQSKGQLAAPVQKGPTPASAKPEKVDVSELAIQPTQSAAAQKPLDLGLGEVNSAYGMQAQGALGAAEAQAKGLEQQAQVYEDLGKKQLEVEKEMKQLRDSRNLEADKRLKEIEDLSIQVNKETEINPNRYWQNLSTGNKIAASIGIALGAIGAAMQGSSENQALKIINNAIERDIEAQKNSVVSARNKLGDAKNLYQLMLQKFGDEETALLATKATHLGQAENQVKAMMAKTQSQAARAQGKILVGQIKEEQAKIGLAVKAQAQKTIVARQAMTGPGVEDPSLLPEEQAKRAVKMPNGLWKPAVSDAGAKVVQEQTVVAGSIKNIVSQLKHLSSPALPLSEKAALIDGLKNEYIAMKKNEMGLGVMSDSDRALVEATIGNPGSIMQDRNRALLEQVVRNVEFKLNKTYETYVPGFKPINVMRK